MDDAYLIIYWNYDDLTAMVLNIYYSEKAARVAFDKELTVYRNPKRLYKAEGEFLQLVAIPVEILDRDGLTTLPEDDETDFSTYTYFAESEDTTELEFEKI